jgi:Fe-S cluster biogenesis protein NfuA
MTSTPEIRITAEPQARPEQCLFRFDRILFPGTVYLSDPAWAEQNAPFVHALFQVGGVRGIQIRQSEALVTLAEKPQDWREPARALGAAARAALSEVGDQEILSREALGRLSGHDAFRAKVQEVIDTRLNPGLASHGGFVEIVDSAGKDLYLNMGGGCQGCSSAAATMTQGVEVAIRDAVPEVENIYDATNHAAGANPYM